MSKLLLICLFVLVLALGFISTKISGASATSIPTGDVQVIKAVYDAKGFNPKRIVVKSGQKVRLEVDAKIDGSGCVGSIAIPRLSQDIQSFVKGKTNVFEITPPSTGQYRITCAMGIPHGTIIAQ